MTELNFKRPEVLLTAAAGALAAVFTYAAGQTHGFIVGEQVNFDSVRKTAKSVCDARLEMEKFSCPDEVVKKMPQAGSAGFSFENGTDPAPRPLTVDAARCTVSSSYDDGESVLTYDFRRGVVSYQTPGLEPSEKSFATLKDSAAKADVRQQGALLPPECLKGLKL